MMNLVLSLGHLRFVMFVLVHRLRLMTIYTLGCASEDITEDTYRLHVARLRTSQG